MKVLVFAPHNDDEVLGVGGTIKKYSNAGHSVYICEVTKGGNYQPIRDEALIAHKALGVEKTIFLDLPVVNLKVHPPKEINASINQVVRTIQPDIVFTPFIGDMHIDHREVTESVLVAVRPIEGNTVRSVYMYETLSETGWNIPNGERSFNPNTWIDITETIEDKIKAMECYQTQIKGYPNPRSSKGIRALAMYRGSTVNVEYAESFILIRNIIDAL